jgi:PqqD family protein of HPr-rel-A system
VDSGARWRAISDSELRWRCWGDECVVYHTGSGDTHLLTAEAVDVLQTLQRKSATAEELADRIETSYHVSWDAELEAHIEQVLTHLRQADLIERVYT